MRQIVSWVQGAAEEAPRLLSEDQFSQYLLRERARTDRTGDPFLLVVLDTSRPVGDLEPRLMESLAEAVLERTRLSDVKGWLEGRVALLLPETHHGHVSVVVRSIEELFIKRVVSCGLVGRPVPTLSYQVYVYPNTGCHVEDGRRFEMANAGVP